MRKNEVSTDTTREIDLYADTARELDPYADTARELDPYADATRELDPYADAVLEIVESIPLGRVMSYGQIAAIVGRDLGTGGPRQVARVMRQYGASVTWWRVLRADGSFAPEVAARQGEALLAEGVRVRGDRVPRSAFVNTQPTPQD